MGLADRVEWLRTLLGRGGRAAVLVVAGVVLLVATPSEGGLVLVGWLVGVVVGAFELVLAGSRGWLALRG